jgi:hypothetical protein
MVLLVSTSLWAQEGALTFEEKNEISEHLQQSLAHLENIISHLSQEQWHYKPVDSIWSIAEISEHLEKSEQQLFGLVSDQLIKSDPEPEKVSEVSGKTKVVMDAITSRDHKFKTRPELEPSGKYQSPQDFLKSFEKLREASIDYATTTEDKLRHHFIPFGPLGDLDGYQILMFMSGHLERHIQQIEEVMNDPNYPST